MKLLVSVCATLCVTGMVHARPQLIMPKQQISTPVNFHSPHVAISGDWMVVGGSSVANPPDESIALNRVYLYHRGANGTWSNGTLLYQSEDRDYYAGVDMSSSIIVITVTNGVHIFENTSAGWVERPIDGVATSALIPVVDVDGTRVMLGTSGCGTTAVILDRMSTGHWAQTAEMHGTQKPCDNTTIGNYRAALSGNTGMLVESLVDAARGEESFIRVFAGTSGTWPQVDEIRRPEGEAVWFPNAMTVHGPTALMAGELGTQVYRRTNGNWEHTGQINYLDAFTQISTVVRFGTDYVAQASYSYPLGHTVVQVFRVLPDQTFEHVAILEMPEDYTEISVMDKSGPGVVAVSFDSVYYWTIPSSPGVRGPVQDDFETGNGTQWTTIAGSNFKVVPRGATHVFRQSDVAGDAAAIFPEDLQTEAIEAEITPTAFNGTDRWFGLFTRYTDESNMYYVSWRNPGRLSLRRKVNGVITELAYTAWSTTLNQPVRVRLESYSNRHAVSINGSEVLTARDNALTHGRVGLRTFRAAADFDNVVISASLVTPFARLTFDGKTGLFSPLDGDWRLDPVPEDESPEFYRQFSLAGDARTLHPYVSEDQVIDAAVRIDAFAAPAPGKVYWAGVLARYQDPRNYYYLSLRSSNEISLRKVVNGQITVLGSAPLEVRLMTGYDNYRLHLEVIGQKMRVYVGDQFMFETTDSTFSSGRVGLVTYKAAASYGAFGAYQP